MSRPFDIQISHVQTYAAGGELVLRCTHCRAQLLRTRKPITLVEQMRAARHPDCPVESEMLIEALGDLYVREEASSAAVVGDSSET